MPAFFSPSFQQASQFRFHVLSAEPQSCCRFAEKLLSASSDVWYQVQRHPAAGFHIHRPHIDSHCCRRQILSSLADLAHPFSAPPQLLKSYLCCFLSAWNAFCILYPQFKFYPFSKTSSNPFVRLFWPILFLKKKWPLEIGYDLRGAWVSQSLRNWIGSLYIWKSFHWISV